MLRATIISVWVMMFLAAAGCVDNNSVDGDNDPVATERPTELIPQVNPPILDLPVPLGFTLDGARSRDSRGAGIRFVDHRYVGRAEMRAVVRFYRRNMETKGWKLMSDQFAQGAGLLSYEKVVAGYTEGCTVRVAKSGSWGNVEIILACSPRGIMTVPNPRR